MNLSTLLTGPVDRAARGLLGAHLVSRIDGETVVVALTEVEAYGADDDAASHAHRGKTKRNGSMFGAPGTAYVYRSYGMHWCLNVAVMPAGVGSAVLLRGAVIVDGESVVKRRRGRATGLTDGPGKLAQALGVNGDHDGIDMLTSDLLELRPGAAPDGIVLATPRVGISKEVERMWRFVVATTVGAPRG